LGVLKEEVSGEDEDAREEETSLATPGVENPMEPRATDGNEERSYSLVEEPPPKDERPDEGGSE